MHRARLDGYFAVVTCDRLFPAVNLDAQQACLDLKVFLVKMVEVETWAFWSVWADEKFAKNREKRPVRLCL